MKSKILILTLACLLVLSLAVVAGASDSQPASKAAGQVLGFDILKKSSSEASSTSEWKDIFTTSIKTANQKDLFVDVSLQSALFTDTTVKSKGMVKDTSTATAGVDVRVLVDGEEAKPGVVTFNERTQTLSATLQGELDLVDANGNGIVDFDELVVVDYEEVSLALDTVSANSFNFIQPDVLSGVHEIKVQAQINLGEEATNGSADATAIIGAGSVTVEEVGMVKDLTVELQ